MESHDQVSFPPRRSLHRIWIFIAGFGIFIPIGLALYFFTGEKAGFFAVAFGFIPLIFIVYRVIAPGSTYTIGSGGVSLKHGRSQRLIPPDEIRGAAVLSSEQAGDILKHYLAPSVESERSMDMKGWYGANYAYGEFTRFCTVPIVQEQVSRGSKRNIVKFGANVAGRFVLLKLSSGQEYILSPEDCDAFFVKLSSLVRLSDTTATSSYDASLDQEHSERVRKFFKWYRWLSLPAVLLIVVLISVLNMKGDGPSRESEISAPMVETGWIDDDTFRFVVSARVEISQEDPEERRTELINTVAEGYRLNFITLVIDDYCDERGIDPDEETYGIMHEILWGTVAGMESNIVSAVVNEDNTELTAVMEMTSPGFRKTLWGILDSI